MMNNNAAKLSLWSVAGHAGWTRWSARARKSQQEDDEALSPSLEMTYK